MSGQLKKTDANGAKMVAPSGIVYRGEKDSRGHLTGKTVVGYWIDGQFVVLSRHDSRGAALNKINALNGGTGRVFTADGNIVGGNTVATGGATAA